jgi:rod shape-determining protein MreC
VATYTVLSMVLLVTGDHLPVSWTRGAGALVFAPFDRLVMTGDRLSAAWRENTTLHETITKLELENARLKIAGGENGRLRDQLGLPEWRGLSLHPVEVLALSGEPIPTAATLSAGTDAGVHAGDALLTRDGLVGRVVESWPRLSRAALLTDPNMAISCEVETTGVNGIVRITLAPRPHLMFSSVPLADTVRTGERVVTSDLSLRFPRGIPVGTVRRIQHDASGLMQEIEIEPCARLSRLRQAFVAPGPRAPDGSDLPRPHLEFEPQRIAPPPASHAAKAAAHPATPRPVAHRHAAADSTRAAR